MRKMPWSRDDLEYEGVVIVNDTDTYTFSDPCEMNDFMESLGETYDSVVCVKVERCGDFDCKVWLSCE